MRIVRFKKAETVRYGILLGNEVAPLINGPFGLLDIPDDAPRFPLPEVQLLSPVTPGKVLAVGRNYAAHAAELGNDVPEEPLVFLKPGSSVIGPGENIVKPPYTKELHHEAELAVVIGRRCKELTPGQVPAHILGYTCANDITARDLQGPDRQWWRAKGSDTFCPLGPWVETELDPAALSVRTEVDGETRQDGSTAQMVHTVAMLISHISAAMTLDPGDVILTGTPAGVGPLHPGDQVTVSVEGIGDLTNRII
ncbi:fumarylacetoacetate hydrolase family protein [Streptomyces halobius]|uniref:Fumarylacetoacetate hydrolase family protein n=1 Tax=Streptomyces halobius TaxID=2879846 RepID=A0ABY4M7M3_9ACTN|nr:fumarylacetoacetate hydrolase family protein [Streptomyces halobius]UQA93720.1 fumarylacetoacetate hydrolase family protein [Streptomyces halobius]